MMSRRGSRKKAGWRRQPRCDDDDVDETKDEPEEVGGHPLRQEVEKTTLFPKVED